MDGVRPKGIVATLVWLLAMRPLQVGLLCVLAMAQALAPALVLWVTKTTIDTVTTAAGEASFVDAVGGLLLLYLALLVGVSVSTQVGNATREVLGDSVAQAVGQQILRHASTLDLAHFEDSNFHNTLRRAEQEAGQRPVQILSETLQLARGAVTLASMLVVLAGLHWAAVILLIAFGTPQLALQTIFARREFELRRQQTEKHREMQYCSYLLTSTEAFKELRVYQLARALLDRREGVWAALHDQRVRLAVRRMWASGVAGALSAAAYVTFYAALAYLALHHEISVGDLVLYSGAYLESQTSLGAVLTGISGLYTSALFVGTLSDFLQHRPSVVSETTPAAGPRRASVVEFRHVSFRYPGEPHRWALRDVSFAMRRGQGLAIVGPNGAGKTTLVKLLCRLYDPDEGSIVVDGRDVRALPLEEYQRMIAVVFQDFTRFHFSAGMNIGLGDIEALGQRRRIEEAARKAGAHAFIKRLPSGYSSMLGKVFHGGCDLSGGQWQRLAIARAFMRQGSIIVLDEPMASLDAITEADVLAHMKLLAEDQIALLISHRLTHASWADAIVVLDDGRIVERGSHLELLARNGLYTRLCNAQLGHLPIAGGALQHNGKAWS